MVAHLELHLKNERKTKFGQLRINETEATPQGRATAQRGSRSVRATDGPRGGQMRGGLGAKLARPQRRKGPLARETS